MKLLHRNAFSRRFAASCVLGALALASSHLSAVAQEKPDAFPSRTIKFIVPLAAGGGTDTVTRLVAAEVQKQLGQTVVVENRAGGQGIPAYQHTLSQPGDGYTVLFATSGHTIQANLFPNLPYQPLKDFTSVAQVAQISVVLIGRPNLPANNLQELLAMAHASGTGLSFGSYGSGTISHLYGELFNITQNTRMVHVPYRGSNVAIPDLIGGHIDLMFADAPSATPLVATRKVKAYAAVGSRRMPGLETVPSFGELGYPAFTDLGWVGAFVSAKTPKAIADKLAAVMLKLNADPAYVARLAALGSVPGYTSVKEFDDQIGRDAERWRKVIVEKNIKSAD